MYRFFIITRHTRFIYQYIRFVQFWISKNKKILKCKNSKFYSNLHIPGDIWLKIPIPSGIWPYRPIQAGIWPVQSRILTYTVFWPVRYSTADTSRYSRTTAFITMSFPTNHLLWNYTKCIQEALFQKRTTYIWLIKQVVHTTFFFLWYWWCRTYPT